MAISFDLDARSAARPLVVFGVMADLRSWDDFGGVALVGPQRRLQVGDRVDAALRVMRQDIRCGCLVRTLAPPSDERAGRVEIRTVDGPFEAVVEASVSAAQLGSDLRVQVHGVGRGAARLLEGPVDYVLQHWANHQLRHLLARAADEHARAGAGVLSVREGDLAAVDRVQVASAVLDEPGGPAR